MFSSLSFPSSSQEKQAAFKKLRVKTQAASKGFVLRNHTVFSSQIVHYSAPSHPEPLDICPFLLWNEELENLIKTQIQN